MLLDTALLVILLLGLLWCAIVTALRVGLARLNLSLGEAEPTVSVIVAARNESRVIARCVKALVSQNYPASKLEIVVVDDGSEDRTDRIAFAAADHAPNFRVIQAPSIPRGVAPKKNALLAGIAATTHEVILTTDADCVPGPDWVRSMGRYFEPGVVAVVGHSPIHCHSRESGNPENHLTQLDSRFRGNDSRSLPRFDSFVNAVVSAGSIGLGIPVTAVGRNFGYRRAAFEEIGGFGASISGASGDDDLLLQRLASPNLKSKILNLKSYVGGLVRFAVDPDSFVPAEGAASFAAWWRMKRRHLSAGVRYDVGMIALSAALYLFNVGLLATVVLAALGQISFWWPVGLWGSKALTDGRTLSRGAALLLTEGWFGAWIVAELLSPLLFTLLIPLSLVGKVKWKGRELGR